MEEEQLSLRLIRLLREPVASASLLRQGYAVVDNVLEDTHANELFKEMILLESSNEFEPNRVQFTVPGMSEPIIAKKPGVFEIDLHNEKKRQRVPYFSALFNGNAFATALQDVEKRYKNEGQQEHPQFASESSRINEMPVRIQTGPSGKTIKLQINQKGAFPMHYDNPGRPNCRRWTCLIYLNRDWKENDGGELVITTFGDIDRAIIVRPLFNRLLVFRSDLILHRVLTAHKRRYCFTIWLDAHKADVNGDEDVFLKKKHLQLPFNSFLGLMKKSPLQRVISRAVYSDVYLDSLLKCIYGGDTASDGASKPVEQQLSIGSKYMLAAHKSQVRALETNNLLGSLIEKVKKHVNNLQVDHSSRSIIL